MLRGLMVIGLALLAVGCTEARAYIRAAASLSAPMHARMLTVWGGNWISDPVIY